MAAHSSILAWRIPWTEEPETTVPRVTKIQTLLKPLSLHSGTVFRCILPLIFILPLMPSFLLSILIMFFKVYLIIKIEL